MKLSPEVLRYYGQAVIRQMVGDISKVEEYVEKALAINEYMCKCGEYMVECIIKNKRSRVKALICTNCKNIKYRGKKAC